MIRACLSIGALLLCVGCVSVPLSHGALAPCPEPSAGRVTAGSAMVLENGSTVMYPVAALSLWTTERAGFVLSGDGLGLRARSRLVPVESLPSLAVIPGISGSLQGAMGIMGLTLPVAETDASISYESFGLVGGGASLGVQIGLPCGSPGLARPRLYLTLEHSFERWLRFGSESHRVWDDGHATTAGVVWVGSVGRVVLAPELLIGHRIKPMQSLNNSSFYVAFTIGVSAPFGRSSQ